MPSVLRPVPHDDNILVSEPPDRYTLDMETILEEASLDASANMQKDQDFSLPMPLFQVYTVVIINIVMIIKKESSCKFISG